MTIVAKVFIPSLMRKLTDGKDILDIGGTTVRGIIENLEKGKQVPELMLELIKGQNID